MRILCLTPIKHLDGIFEHLSSFGSVDYKPDLNFGIIFQKWGIREHTPH